MCLMFPSDPQYITVGNSSLTKVACTTLGCQLLTGYICCQQMYTVLEMCLLCFRILEGMAYLEGLLACRLCFIQLAP